MVWGAVLLDLPRRALGEGLGLRAVAKGTSKQRGDGSQQGSLGQGDGSRGLGLVFHSVGEGGSLGLEEEGLIPDSSQAVLMSSGGRTDP